MLYFEILVTSAVNNMNHLYKPISMNFSTLQSAADVNEGKTEITLKYTPVYSLIELNIIGNDAIKRSIR